MLFRVGSPRARVAADPDHVVAAARLDVVGPEIVSTLIRSAPLPVSTYVDALSVWPPTVYGVRASTLIVKVLPSGRVAEVDVEALEVLVADRAGARPGEDAGEQVARERAGVVDEGVGGVVDVDVSMPVPPLIVRSAAIELPSPRMLMKLPPQRPASLPT